MPRSRALEAPHKHDTPAVRRLIRLGRWLDSSIRLPGGYRIGWDGIVGLIPGVGDLIGLLLSSGIVLATARLGVPRVVLARMAVNVGLEALIGAVPVVGDVFDFVFKANERNLALAFGALDARRAARQRSAASLALLGAVAVGLVLLIGWAIVSLLGAIAAALAGWVG